MNEIQKLQPQCTRKNFYALAQVPRTSGHLEKILQFLLDFGKQAGVEAFKFHFILLATFFIASGRTAKADDTIFRYLHVVEQDSSETVYALSQTTKVNLTPDFLRITFGDYSMKHVLSDVVKIYYEKKIVPTDIDVSTQKTINIHQIPDNATVFAYTLNGKLLFSHRNTNSSVKSAIQSLKKGVYLLKINDTTYKYLKP